ncbi:MULTISPECIES: carboxymuconolactone decarboxylase family protein [unclassified Mycolicibacterium]|uniref:carboxymuconolactone decarboxylase family protein n=1 Tax=unclassified Mycolicibacterium TaxID=2636767 RepID=UPI0012DD944C|nr:MULTISPECIES: carboxymuconolactone decarboxylase family protein [unclassified Mycolicibacterium]MUL84157.1 carboxymuconolactone decarboxylase family protein [Mycolicibacterium sp. CBMA 329]MUL89777.1 carboxymuconolactone decarboxylase family protein [Mycolicibacterium sp. CBMA 331]MUL99951.1 carboxymuconolactone decarboxylase family protein [Mycolicibacterium sp. CBMA 334]MUM27104.1 carboxymuconolactone decarboxylase family protein [Mycolicibacterium sp. CBMA 295]MUM39292.1 carboxymuconolac
MTNAREQGLRVLQELVPHLSAESVEPDGSFGDELMAIGVDNVFGRLWSREGLSRRDRSLVTMGILIALRATDEFESHVKIGLRNGLTEDEIAEVIYHASGYAGFPAANTACKAARDALTKD